MTEAYLLQQQEKFFSAWNVFYFLHDAYKVLILAGEKQEVNRCLAIMSSRLLRNVLYHSQNQHEACTVIFDDVKERSMSLFLEALNKGKRTQKFFSCQTAGLTELF